MLRQRLAHNSLDYRSVERHNDVWEHVTRANVTAGFIAAMRPESMLDPACGDGSIALAACRIHEPPFVALNDISVPNVTFVRSVAPATWKITDVDVLEAINASDRVDLIVLTEILEHLESPDEVLRAARSKARRLVASSPEIRPGQGDPNEEHLWAFDSEGYRDMLSRAGWSTRSRLTLYLSYYDFQVVEAF